MSCIIRLALVCFMLTNISMTMDKISYIASYAVAAAVPLVWQSNYEEEVQDRIAAMNEDIENQLVKAGIYSEKKKNELMMNSNFPLTSPIMDFQVSRLGAATLSLFSAHLAIGHDVKFSTSGALSYVAFLKALKFVEDEQAKIRKEFVDFHIETEKQRKKLKELPPYFKDNCLGVR